MSKSNIIVTVVLAALSILLLCLWYFQGFSTTDAPLDLVLSVVWWIVIVIGVVLVTKTGKTNR